VTACGKDEQFLQAVLHQQETGDRAQKAQKKR
jgi:hypothetical protein